MLKPIKEFTSQEAARLCLERKAKAEREGYNKCIGCPAAIQYAHTNMTLCYFNAMASVRHYANTLADDGSVDDKDIPYWCK